MVPDTEEHPEDVTEGLAEPVTDGEEDTLCEGDIVPDTVPVSLTHSLSPCLIKIRSGWGLW